MRNRLRPVLLLALLQVSVLLMAFPGKALGCSCMEPDIDRNLHEADAAFVGELVSSRTASGGGPFADVVLLFQVEEWVKGDLGPTVEIHTSSSSASCGIGAEIGRSGVLVHVSEGKLTSGLCSVVSPEDLIAGGQAHQPDEASTPPLVVDAEGNSGDGSSNQLARLVFIGLAVLAAGAAIAHRISGARTGPEAPGQG